VFTYAGTDGTASSSTSAFTSTILSIGPAVSSRYVIVALADQNSVTLSGVTVNGISLIDDVDATFGAGSNPGLHIYSGLVGTAGGAGNATIVANYVGAGFTGRAIGVWYATGMAHTTGAVQTAFSNTGANTINIASANAGDFIVGLTYINETFGSSTQAPTATPVTATFAPPDLVTPYWNVVTSPATPFAVTATGSAIVMCAASYR
jgi:hypothetical protein